METFENGLAIYNALDGSSQVFQKIALDLWNAFKFCKEDLKSILISISKRKFRKQSKGRMQECVWNNSTQPGDAEPLPGTVQETATGNPLCALLGMTPSRELSSSKQGIPEDRLRFLTPP